MIQMILRGCFLAQDVYKRQVQALACVMKERFGQNAEPLYERLIRFLETLRENKYIHLNKDGEEAQKAGSASKQCCREA